MANGKGTLAVQSVGMVNGKVQFLGSVDFSPERIVVPSETGFPPKEAKPGAIGEALYTPLIQLPNGIVLNAPQIKNNSGTHDRLIRIDLEKRTATFKMTDGFFEGRRVHYTSFNASDPAIAALEAANYTPNLKALPNKGSNGPGSGLTGLAPVVNGPTGKMNPYRQGLASALMGEGDPLNIVQEIPFGARALAYSPMWDVHATVWVQVPMPASSSVQLTDFNEVEKKGLRRSDHRSGRQVLGPDRCGGELPDHQPRRIGWPLSCPSGYGFTALPRSPSAPPTSDTPLLDYSLSRFTHDTDSSTIPVASFFPDAPSLGIGR